MRKEKIIHRIIQQVNWEFVVASTNLLHFKKGKKFTKTELVEELTDLIKNVIETNKRHLVTDFWSINFEQSENGEDFILEVIYTPMIAWVDTFKKSVKKEKEGRLQQRLKLALEIEDYEKANKIQKDLEKLLPKLK